MNVPWQTPKCILCLSTDGITEEHLIPKSIEGKLVSKFLCQVCNSELGYRAESPVTKDPLFRRSIELLIPKRPDLADRLRGRRAIYFGLNEKGKTTKYFHRDETFRSMVQSRDDPVQEVPDNEVTVILPNAYAFSNETEMVDAATKDWIGELPSHFVVPDLTGHEMNPVVPAKIAFEFLALHCGDDIYQDLPAFASIRYQLQKGELEEDHVRVTRMEAMNNRLFHGLLFEGNNPGACVQVRLFGRWTYFVSFPCIAIRCRRYWYEHDLESDKEEVGFLKDEFR